MKLKRALFLILVVSAVLMPIIATQPIPQTSTPEINLESPTTSCGIIKPNDPGSGGGGRGET